MRRRDSAAERGHLPFELPGLTPTEACDALVELSALTWAEVMVLEATAAGEHTVLDLTRQQAAGRLARWRGPIPGLRLMPLPHWGTAWVERGAPFDPERRALAAEEANQFELPVE